MVNHTLFDVESVLSACCALIPLTHNPPLCSSLIHFLGCKLHSSGKQCIFWSLSSFWPLFYFFQEVIWIKITSEQNGKCGNEFRGWCLSEPLKRACPNISVCVRSHCAEHQTYLTFSARHIKQKVFNCGALLSLKLFCVIISVPWTDETFQSLICGKMKATDIQSNTERNTKTENCWNILIKH